MINCCFRNNGPNFDDLLSCITIDDTRIAMVVSNRVVGYVPSNMVESFSEFLQVGKIITKIRGAEILINNVVKIPVDYIFYGNKESLYNLIAQIE